MIKRIPARPASQSEYRATALEAVITSDREICHPSGTRGLVITRVQTIEAGGRRFEARFWSQFETGALHHVDSIEVTP